MAASVEETRRVRGQLRRYALGGATVAVGSFVLLGTTGGGFQIMGVAQPSLDKCTFSPDDTPYEYPGQPLATDDPPYSTLFQYVCMDHGTEIAQLNLETRTDRNDTYVCACCGAKLFGGEAKFDSRTGWPSFWAPYDADAVGYARDKGNVEIHCSKCKAHLGHVFSWSTSHDNPTGLRYCIDGVCLRKVARAADETGGAYPHDLPLILDQTIAVCVLLLGAFACIWTCGINWLLTADWRRRRRGEKATLPRTAEPSVAPEEAQL